jgi:hypothetical protein
MVAWSEGLGAGGYGIAIAVSKSVAQGGSLDRVACIRHLGDVAHRRVPRRLQNIMGFFLGPLTALGALLVGAGLIITALVIALRRRPRMAASLLGAALLPLLLWRPIDWTAYSMHLALAVSTGAVQPDGPFVGYDWSVGLAGGPATFLIYDVTDEIALPPELHKQPIAFEQGFGEICAGKVIHLLGHYYVCEFDNAPS